MAQNEMVERAMTSIEATAPNANEGLVFTYGQVERGLIAALAPTAQNEMVERVARAIYANLGEQEDGNAWELPDDLTALYLDQDSVDFAKVAEAALSAIIGDEAEQIISAWAFAHNIDGAARNDLFARLKAQGAAIAALAPAGDEVREALLAARQGLSCPTCGDWCDDNPVCKQIDAALAKEMGKP